MKQNLLAAIVLGGSLIFSSIYVSSAIKELAIATEKKKEIDVGFQHTGYQMFDAQGMKLNVRLKSE